MNIGTQIYNPTRGTFGVIKDEKGREFYTEEKAEGDFVFEITSVGPHKKYKRAINFLTYNRALEKLVNFSKESFSEKKKILRALNNLTPSGKFSPQAKRGLNLWKRKKGNI